MYRKVAVAGYRSMLMCTGLVNRECQYLQRPIPSVITSSTALCFTHCVAAYFDKAAS